MTITLGEYFGPNNQHPAATPAIFGNAIVLLRAVNSFLKECELAGIYNWVIDMDTKCCVSGSPGGSGAGGWRPPESTTGAKNSKHKLGQAVDVYDPLDKIDRYVSKFDTKGGALNKLLERHGLYREAPTATPGWCHLQCVQPGSGRRTFLP